MRATMLSRIVINDLDNDGTITSDELRRILAFQPTSDAASAFFTQDKDGDGALSPKEIYAAVEEMVLLQAGRQRRGQRWTYAELLDFDGDGFLTEAEFARGVAALDLMQTEDSRQPGRQAGLDPAIKSPAPQEQSGPCKLPAAPKGVQLVLLSVHEGSALSTVSVAGMDQETKVATLRIEAGKRPVYLILNALTPTVWQIGGAVDRVARVVVIPTQTFEGPGAGVTGIAADRVSFVPPGSCFAPFKQTGAGSKASAQAMEERLGVRPETVVGIYTIGGVALPSGALPLRPKQPQLTIQHGNKIFELDGNGVKEVDTTGTRGLERSLRRFNPDGSIEVNLADVVAPSPAQAYDVLPQEAGLMQLVKTGVLRHLRADNAFVIQREIPRFPAGLNGAHAVKFVLARGVRMPGGSPGHSSVVQAGTGRCLVSRCR